MEGRGEDPWEVLGLEPGAPRERVERAYRFSLEMYGEDALAMYSLFGPAELEELRSRIRRAYAQLVGGEHRPEGRRGGEASTPGTQVIPFPSSSSAAAEVELPEVLTGADLRRVRQARGVTLRQMADVTKIGTRFLEYIEADRFSLLPPRVYLRGFLLEYARMVGLDPQTVAESYMKRLPSGG